MIHLTREERQLKILLSVSAWTFFLVGLAFATVPGQVLGLVNRASALLNLGFPDMPLSTEKFWLSLAFSMMMTITALCCVAQHNVRRNKGYVIPLLISKATSALSAIAFFVFSARYFAYVVIFVVDGSIFWVTLLFYLRASRSFFEAHTAYLRKTAAVSHSTGPTSVVSLHGDDKLPLLNAVLEQSGFFEALQRRYHESGRSAGDFAVVIKPNFMFMHSKRDHSTYTDPALVEALVDAVVERGFPNVTLVEAQSTFGNYYKRRDVLTVAQYIGYSISKNYRIVDLTEEMVPYDYGGRLGKHRVGPTWRDADFRISFAKNKTHVFCHYTLTLKNIYGTLPMQNKLREYHTKREYDWPTIETLRRFPVHFGLIDAVYSADGQFGVIVCPEPKHTRTIIGGENLIAVDWVGAKKMGLDPDDPRIGRFLPLAVEAFGRPEINWVGDRSVYEPWENVSEVFIQSLDAIEEAYAFSDWWFSALTAMDKFFPFKKRSWPVLLLRRIMRPVKRLFYRYDHLE